MVAGWKFLKTLLAPSDDPNSVKPLGSHIIDPPVHLVDSSKLEVRGAWFFASVWNLLCWPIAGLVWSTSSLGWPTLLVSVFPLVGIALLYFAVKISAMARRTRGTSITTEPHRLTLGSNVLVKVDLPANRLKQTTSFQLTITESRILDSDSSPTPRAAWSQKHIVLPQMLANGHGVLKANFELPTTALPTDAIEDGLRTTWTLELLDISNGDQQSYVLNVDKGVQSTFLGAASGSSKAGAAVQALGTWKAIENLDSASPTGIPHRVMRVTEKDNVWSATFSTATSRAFGVLSAVVSSCSFFQARQNFLGDGSTDGAWTIGWLILACLTLGMTLHFWSKSWRLVVTQRGLTKDTSSWLWPARRQLPGHELMRFEMKYAYRIRVGRNVLPYYQIFARSQRGERIQLTPGIAHDFTAHAVAHKIRATIKNYAALFAPQVNNTTGQPFRVLLGYGLLTMLSGIAIMGVSLNSTYRFRDPISVQRLAKDWSHRLERLKPGQRLYYELVTAQDNSDLPQLETLLKQGASPNTVVNNGSTLLMLAARRGELAHVELLLRYGADVNQRDETSNDNRGDSALLVALHGGHESVVRSLLAAGAQMDVQNMWDWGPMHMAAQGNCIPCLELVKSYGVSLHTPATASRGETPAMLAAGKGRLEALQWFVQQGVDLKQHDPNGQTALDWAIFFHRDNTAQWIRESLK